jgi:hypothetical protein
LFIDFVNKGFVRRRSEATAGACDKTQTARAEKTTQLKKGIEAGDAKRKKINFKKREGGKRNTRRQCEIMKK